MSIIKCSVVDQLPPIHAATQTNFRLEVTLPKMDLYNVDNVLNVIAAASEPFDCGKFCSQCEISRAHEQKRIETYKYDCEGLRSRHHVLRHLCLQLKRQIDLGRFQVWDSERHYAREFPWATVSCDLFYSNMKNWARTDFIFPDDLLVFLSSEKIRANFVTYGADLDGKIIPVLCGGEEKLDESAPTIGENVSGEKRAESPPEITTAVRVNTADVTRKKPQRFDYLAVEIDEILTNDPAMTTSKVYHALTSKIGAGSTCIIGVTDVGLRWKNAKGELAIASDNNIADRVARWKKARK